MQTWLYLLLSNKYCINESNIIPKSTLFACYKQVLQVLSFKKAIIRLKLHIKKSIHTLEGMDLWKSLLKWFLRNHH